MLYRFETKITDDDYLEFNKYILLNSPKNKKMFLKVKILAVALMAVIWLIFLIGNASPLFLAVYGTVAAAFSVHLCLTLERSSIKMLKKNLSDSKKKGKLSYSPSAVLEFYDDRFTELTDTNKSEIKYEAISEVIFNREQGVYIFTYETLAYIIPLASFGSDELVNEFITFIKGKKQEK